MLRSDSMSSSFQAVSELHTFCLIRCNRKLILTYICNLVQLPIFLANIPYPSLFKSSEMSQQEHRQQKIHKLKGRRNAKKIWIFQNPRPNYAADHYHKIISWEVDGQYQPPFTISMTDDIRSFADTPQSTWFKTTNVCAKTISAKKWDGMIHSILAKRKEKPRFEAKSDFVS